jgi:phosphoglycerol transferase MdoB-like AlkP superfamily enzyme
MNQIIITYILYLAISICLTIWVAKTLFRNGKVFLVDIFHGNKELADSVNNLLLVGFYLINLGYAVYTLQITRDINDVRQMVEVLSLKIGLIILILGFMHFMNLYIFFTLRRRAINREKTIFDKQVEMF